MSVVSNFDSHRAQIAFDERVKGWPPTRLAELERDLAGRVAEQSLGLRHFIVLAPGIAASDGIPWLSRVTRLPRALEATDEDAARALLTALRTAPGLGLSVAIADRDDIANVLVDTVIGSPSAAVSGPGVLRIGDEFQIILTATHLPSTVHPGAVVDALIRSRAKGFASLHVLPVDAKVARTVLHRRAAMQRYTAREGNDAVDNQVALADTTAALAAIAQRQLIPCRIALSFAVRDCVLAKAARNRRATRRASARSGLRDGSPDLTGSAPFPRRHTRRGAPRAQPASDIRCRGCMSDSRFGHSVWRPTAATHRDQSTHRSARIPLNLEPSQSQRRAGWQLGVGQECRR